MNLPRFPQLSLLSALCLGLPMTAAPAAAQTATEQALIQRMDQMAAELSKILRVLA